MNQTGKARTILTTVLIGLIGLVIFGLLWASFFATTERSGLGWYFFGYTMGLTMIVLPCTLPLAFVIVPLSMKKGGVKGLGVALAFGLGVVVMLSMYGVAAAVVGKTIQTTVTASQIGVKLQSFELVKNWVYLFAGLLAYLFALGELGFIKFRMPSYTGAAPAFIQNQHDYLKAFLLGLFLGNVGVGCPHPATPLIFIEIITSANIFYGWTLFLVHAIGRVVPLLLLAILGILGVNGLTWLVARKEKVERATGWVMVYVAAFILVLGLFTHAWWVNSGQHTLLEDITGEKQFLGKIINQFHLGEVPHRHGLEIGTGLLGLPLWLGNWALAFFWIAPLWWYYRKKERSISALPEEEKKTEYRMMPWRFWFLVVLSLLLAQLVIYTLPTRFFYQSMVGEDNHLDNPMTEEDSTHSPAAIHEETEVREGLVVNMNASPALPVAGSATTLDFFVNEKPGAIPVASSLLQVEHEKLMHVIGVRSDMNEFFHIHPNPSGTPGMLSVDYVFSKPGRYKIWSEITKDNVDHKIGHPELLVGGGGAVEEKQISFARSMTVGDYQVALLIDEPVVKGKESRIAFDLHALTGDEVVLENFLGAQMHLAIIKDDWTQFIHAHPMGDSHMSASVFSEAMAHGDEDAGHAAEIDDHGVEFREAFPEAGLYRIFGQFRPVGSALDPDKAILVSFWVQVSETAPASGLPIKWILGLASLVLMTVLSLGVSRFLKVKTA